VQRDDKVLVEETLGGDQKAFTVLVKRHREAIYHVIFKIIKDREEAKDLVQETFVKVFNSLSSYRPEFRFTTWLYKIAANCAIDFLSSWLTGRITRKSNCRLNKKVFPSTRQ
jgi:RNA polymerase sigma-70 factor (ECF subfamily)